MFRRVCYGVKRHNSTLFCTLSSLSHLSRQQPRIYHDTFQHSITSPPVDYPKYNITNLPFFTCSNNILLPPIPSNTILYYQNYYGESVSKYGDNEPYVHYKKTKSTGTYRCIDGAKKMETENSTKETYTIKVL